MRNFQALLQEIDQLLESLPNTSKPFPTPEGERPADAAIDEDELLASLTRHFGHTGFRENQREIIEAILNEDDVLAAFRPDTGNPFVTNCPHCCCRDLPWSCRP